MITGDEAKRRQNIAKHGIDLAHCEVIFDAPMLTVEDQSESYGEKRLQSLGLFYGVVVFMGRQSFGPTPNLGSQKVSNMKSANTGQPFGTNLAKLKKRSDSEIDVTGTPYNAHSAQHVNRFWENATVMPPRLRGQRGPQRTPTKQMVSMRLDRLVVEHFKADGPHWQTRVNDTLLKIVKKSIASTRRCVKVNVQRPIPASQRSKVGAKTGALGRRPRAKGKPIAKRA